MNFVNIHGDSVSIERLKAAAPKVARKTDGPGVYHKGFRVVGVPPGALESAAQGHARVVAMAANAGGAPIKPFDPAGWLLTFRKKPVRAKPYELYSAADLCTDMARKAGWTAVEVRAQSKDGA